MVSPRVSSFYILISLVGFVIGEDLFTNDGGDPFRFSKFEQITQKLTKIKSTDEAGQVRLGLFELRDIVDDLISQSDLDERFCLSPAFKGDVATRSPLELVSSQSVQRYLEDLLPLQVAYCKKTFLAALRKSFVQMQMEFNFELQRLLRQMQDRQSVSLLQHLHQADLQSELYSFVQAELGRRPDEGDILSIGQPLVATCTSLRDKIRYFSPIYFRIRWSPETLEPDEIDQISYVELCRSLNKPFVQKVERNRHQHKSEPGFKKMIHAPTRRVHNARKNADKQDLPQIEPDFASSSYGNIFDPSSPDFSPEMELERQVELLNFYKASQKFDDD